MSKTPWTSDDPQPGDFDDVIDSIDAALIEDHPGNPDVRVRLVVDLDGEDADRLSRIAVRRGETARDVISDLLRDADRPAA